MADETDVPTTDVATPGDEAPTLGFIQPIEIQEEMEQSFLDYAMSVIVSRALPDARDGLKPVHRRILWGMYDLGARPDRPTMKCARVTGEVMGKYHPHGDLAIYDALVRMGQNFSLRHPVVHPKGNFGYSPDDAAAAARYTECRLDPIALDLLAGIDEDTVDFTENYSGEFTEPVVLPARFPNLLVNGSQGIAVGMATNIPTHNLGEVIDATIHLIDHPDATPDDLMEHLPAPDFPTGALILGRSGIREAYRTGRGQVRMRARTDIEEGQRSSRIVVSELPYQSSPNLIMSKIRDLVDAREIEGIADINDESAQGRTRIVITLKRDAPALVILNNLFKRTPLQTTFSVNTVALVDEVPRTLNLRELLVAYVDHQVEVVRRRSEFRLAKARDEAHITEGLLKALDLIDDIIALIRGSADRATAREGLMGDDFEFSEVQANHILDMQLARLTRLGRTNLEERMVELQETIAELEAILGDEERLRSVIKDELGEVRARHATPRRSEMIHDPGELDIEDLIDDEEMVFAMSTSGYVKTMSIGEFRTQGRGGKGVTGAKLKDEDAVAHLIHTTAHAYLLFFSTRGRVYRLKAHEIPSAGRTARGTSIVNLLPLQPDERIQAVIDTRDYESNRFLFFAMRSGRVKKTLFTAYDSSLKAGLIAVRLNDGDELVAVVPTNGDDDLFLVSSSGQTLRISEDDVRPMGRSVAGVRGMKFRDEDVLVSCCVARADATILHLTTEGYGKRTELDEFTVKGRAGLGVRGIRTTDDRGRVAGALVLTEDEDLFAITTAGMIIRMPATDISVQGRDATGVRVMSPGDGQEVAAVSPVPAGEPDEEFTEELADGLPEVPVE
ncbi:MAG: DNA gyrase subunit A [Acidimicrobiales bacterium]|nr:DNA gyrase subunit A [Acidimicrobiales bacterium]